MRHDMKKWTKKVNCVPPKAILLIFRHISHKNRLSPLVHFFCRFFKGNAGGEISQTEKESIG